MFRPLCLFAVLLVVLPPAPAQDAIPPETVVAVKKATVFVSVQAGTMKGSGSGFVVAADKNGLLVATNYHVLTPLPRDRRVRQSPAEVARTLKAAAVTVVFDGGTRTEQSAKAEAVAADAEADLAVLRVADVKDPPKPIDCAAPAKLSETMGVYTFGFPFGQALATGKGAPAITVGRGSVSSLRLDDKGDLSLVQIDGALNPGNSGGPVVDAKGLLVGVAVSTVKNGQGIGFAVPAAELNKLLKGRLAGITLTATRAAGGKLTLRAEVGVVDPAAALAGVTLHYVVVPPKGKRPDAKEALERHAGAQKAALKIEAGVAAGEVTVDATEGEVHVQATPDGGPGAAGASAVRVFGLVAPRGAGPVALVAPGAVPPGRGAGEAPAPAGWKEFPAANRALKVWAPEKAAAAEKARTVGRGAQRLAVASATFEVPGGPVFAAEYAALPPRAAREDAAAVLREAAAEGGKVVGEADARLGRYPGTEYLVERGDAAARVRVFVAGGGVYLLRVTGTREQVDGADAGLFLDSCRVQLANRPGAERGPRIQGGGNAEFRDIGPDGGLLAGLEVGLGKFFDNDIVVAVRPVYRVGEVESRGEQYGADTGRVVKVVAKPGYAVAALSLKTGLGVDGLSVTFMRVDDGQLDPADSYESEWVGGKGGGGPVKLGGDGTPVVGLLGRTNGKDVTGLGLAYAGEKPWPPGKPTRILGGGDVESREGAPDGGLLVGFEVGVSKFFEHDVVRAVRPVYRVGDTDSLGEQYGTDTSRVVKVVARPGYAVGAVLARTGLGVDGFSVIFMRVADGKLDPRDNYESEWVGGKAEDGLIRVTGEGRLVTGVVVKANAKDATGLGLLVKEPDPKGGPNK